MEYSFSTCTQLLREQLLNISLMVHQEVDNHSTSLPNQPHHHAGSEVRWDRVGESHVPESVDLLGFQLGTGSAVAIGVLNVGIRYVGV